MRGKDENEKTTGNPVVFYVVAVLPSLLFVVAVVLPSPSFKCRGCSDRL